MKWVAIKGQYKNPEVGHSFLCMHSFNKHLLNTNKMPSRLSITGDNENKTQVSWCYSWLKLQRGMRSNKASSYDGTQHLGFNKGLQNHTSLSPSLGFAIKWVTSGKSPDLFEFQFLLFIKCGNRSTSLKIFVNSKWNTAGKMLIRMSGTE